MFWSTIHAKENGRKAFLSAPCPCVLLFIFFIFLSPIYATNQMEHCKPGKSFTRSRIYRLLHSDICGLVDNVFSKTTSKFLDECAHKCLEDIFCAGFAFKEKQENEKPNCQLTNTLDNDFHEKVCSSDDRGWNFYHPVGPRKVSCIPVNKCRNGGTMFIDLSKGPGSDPYKCACPVDYDGDVCEILKGNFALNFRGNTMEYGISEGSAQKLSSISICVWFNAPTNHDPSKEPSMLSYASDVSFNEFVLYFGPDVRILRRSEDISTGLRLDNGNYHHLCVTWQLSEGEAKFYINGSLTVTKMTDKATIEGGGIWVIGQDQDARGGGFETADSFKGHTLKVNVWDKVLSLQEIAALASNMCTPVGEQGNVKAYNDFELRGNVTRFIPEFCLSTD